MKPTTFIIAALGIACFLFACERDINYHGEEVSPKMVLNSIIDCNESSHFIEVSESVFAFSDQKPKPVDVSDISLKINGTDVAVKHNHRKDQSDYYAFNAALNPGDKIEISGSSALHGHLKGTDLVPEPPQIIHVTPEWFTGAVDGISYLRTKVRIKDRQNQDNYYRIVIHTKTIFSENNPNDIDWHHSEVYVDQEILFKEISGTLGDTNTSMFAIFSDELFQGEEYLLNVYIRYDNFSYSGAEQYVKVEIHSLSENLYKYLRSLELATNGDYFSEPVKIFSNIKGGFGILGTYTTGQMAIKVE